MFSRMSSTDARANEDRYVGFRLDSEETKRLAKMRYAQRGFDTMQDYMQALVDEDLEESDLSLE